MLNLFFCIFVVSVQIKSYPVVLLHGILSNKGELKPVEKWINDNSPTSNVYNIEIGNGKIDSISKPMDWQLTNLCDTIYSNNNLKNGFNFIGFSQGGLLARGYIEKCNMYPVLNLITFGTPHAGIVNLVSDFKNIYNTYNQEHISFSGYWKDPMRYSLYLNSATYLPVINNERDVNAKFKSNMESLKNFVMIWSSIDGVIYPVESSKFGYYKDNTYAIQNMSETRQYTENLIGLKTLHENGKINIHEVDCKHVDFKTSECLDRMKNFLLSYI